ALFCGRETHAGEPLSGMTSQFIASFLTQKMEWNDAFSESVLGETTPLPVTLSQMDLKDDYSTQTSSRTAALYNVFMMEQNAKEKLTEEKKNLLMSNVNARTDFDERDKTIRIVDALMLECLELAPAMVLFFAPPYYPAVNTSNDTLIKEKIRFIQEEAENNFNLSVKQVH